jgi:hypothetical protein
VRICRLIETTATEAIHSRQEHISLALLRDDLVTGSLVSIVDRRNRRVSARALLLVPSQLPFAPRPLPKRTGTQAQGCPQG